MRGVCLRRRQGSRRARAAQAAAAAAARLGRGPGRAPPKPDAHGARARRKRAACSAAAPRRQSTLGAAASARAQMAPGSSAAAVAATPDGAPRRSVPRLHPYRIERPPAGEATRPTPPGASTQSLTRMARRAPERCQSKLGPAQAARTAAYIPWRWPRRQAQPPLTNPDGLSRHSARPRSHRHLRHR